MPCPMAISSGASCSGASAIQNALDSLREKNFLWRARRGAYWPEDEQHVRWLIGQDDKP